MGTPTHLEMPPDILSLIFQYVYKSNKVELEFYEHCTISTTPCRLLRVCKALRYNIFETCRQKALRLVYTLRTPAALTRLCSDADAHLSVKSICIILTCQLEYPLTNDETADSLEGLMTKPWIEAWRTALRNVPSQTELLIFDLVHHSRLPSSCVARIMSNLSFILKHRTSGQAICRFVGSRTIVEQRYLESHTIKVIPGTDGYRGRPKWPSRDALHTSRRSLKQANEAHATEEIGDQFGFERAEICCRISMWSFGS
jgi:hypothetical protein